MTPTDRIAQLEAENAALTAERDALAAQVATLLRWCSCEECGRPGVRLYSTEGDGNYWLCDGTDADHAMPERYSADEILFDATDIAAAATTHDAAIATRTMERAVEIAEEIMRHEQARAHTGNTSVFNRGCEIAFAIAARLRAESSKPQ